MSLINREDVIDEILWAPDVMSVCVSIDECHGIRRMKNDAIEILKNAREVEAIPVSWIEEYATYLGKPADVYLAEKTLLTAMIKKWREENADVN